MIAQGKNASIIAESNLFEPNIQNTMAPIEVVCGSGHHPPLNLMAEAVV